MGGYGSGRRKSEEREHVEDCTGWNIRALHWQAQEQGDLIERCLWRRLDQHKIRERIEIAYTPCHYGGARPWFVCPGCGERKGVLYLGYTEEDGGKELRCRTCYGLCYEIQNEDWGSRRLRQSGRIRVRLLRKQPLHVLLAQMLQSVQMFRIPDLPPRPLGMHHTTYERLIRELTEAMEDGLDLKVLPLLAHNEKFLAQHESRVAGLQTQPKVKATAAKVNLKG